MTQPMQIQSAVIPACEPESMKAVNTGCVKAGSRIMHGVTQHGFSLVSAIFLLVVIAALGTFAVTLSTTQQQSSALDVLGSRAYQAARAGIEWSAYQVVPNSAAAFASNCRTAGTNSQVLPAGTLAGTLADFNVNVGCSATSAVEAATTVWVYSIVSTASGVAGATVGSPSYIERQITATIAQ